ncbi:MAG: phosphoribosylformylglycinamidine synthase, partial [Rhodocyclaceae bacterium]|nr:phosphoribosylformylglycinamidine synthase [Rhodocyclaceae bacterium]
MAEILKLRGIAAFSASRLSRIAEQVRERVPSLAELAAEHWYFVEVERPLADEQLARLKDLLGIPSRLPAAPAGELLLVTPRLGTISPWSSKATDIARNCGFAAVRRVERGIAFHATGRALDHAALAAKLHDRMTESVLAQIDDAAQLFRHVAPQPLTSVDVLARGRAGL